MAIRNLFAVAIVINFPNLEMYFPKDQKIKKYILLNKIMIEINALIFQVLNNKIIAKSKISDDVTFSEL